MVPARDRRAIAVIAAGYLASLAVYSRLPGPYLAFAQSFSFARALIAFLLPTAALLTYALLGRLWRLDPIRAGDPSCEVTYKAMLFRITLFLIALHAMVIAELVGLMWMRAWAPRAVLVLFGLLLVGIGDLLPRTRPNIVIGIRTSRTLSDRRLWMETHRVVGYVSVAMGIVIAVTGAFLSKTAMTTIVNLAAAVGVGILVAHYRKHSHA